MWGAGVIAGLYAVTTYSNKAADVLPQPGRWPEGAKITLARDRPTLLVTLHPQCVCSRATLEELARLIAQTPAPVRVQVLLYRPRTAPDSWAESDLTARVRAMPGVAVLTDPDGRESERFGMSVSGQTAVYSPDGRLLFSGGITRARGHAGDNAGRAAILSILSNRHPRRYAHRCLGARSGI